MRGLRQAAQVCANKGEFMTLIFIAALEAENDGDTIEITGRPNLEVKRKGTNGDITTSITSGRTP